MLLSVLAPHLHAAILEQQYLARRRGHAVGFGRAEEQVIMVGGSPVGVIITERRTDTIRVMDIALLPEAQSAGVGSEVLRRLLAEADRERQTVRLSVDPANHRAHSLYVRLGFVATESNPIEIAMERPPGRYVAD